MLLVAVVVVVASASMGFGLRPEIAASPLMWILLGAPQLALGLIAVWRLRSQADIGERLRPRWGDLSIGILMGGALIAASWGGRSLLTPVDSEGYAWLMRLYLQIGPSDAIQRSLTLTGTVLAIAALEEVVWRGLVLGELEHRVGQRRAWMLTAVLYALATVPTAFTLADPTAGLNPLLPVAALGCGLVWSFAASVLKRLPPVVISHMVFTYYLTVQFRPPGL